MKEVCTALTASCCCNRDEHCMVTTQLVDKPNRQKWSNLAIKSSHTLVIRSPDDCLKPLSNYINSMCLSCTMWKPTKVCTSECVIGFTFTVLAHPSSPGQRVVKWVLLLFSVWVVSLASYLLCRRVGTSVSWHIGEITSKQLHKVVVCQQPSNTDWTNFTSLSFANIRTKTSLVTAIFQTNLVKLIVQLHLFQTITYGANLHRYPPSSDEALKETTAFTYRHVTTWHFMTIPWVNVS